jgi:hypothetical protein
MKNLRPLDIMFPVGVVAMVFMGIFTLFLISDSSLTTRISQLDTQLGSAIRHSRFGLMNQLAPRLGKVFFWIPFYCTVLLVLAGLERVKFLRICAALAACLLVLAILILGFNALAAFIIPPVCNQTGNINGKTVTMGPCFSLATGAAVSFGLAVFAGLYLGKRYWLIKLLLFTWAILICYGLLYQADYFPGTLILSITAGGIIAAGCNTLFKYLSEKLYPRP